MSDSDYMPGPEPKLSRRELIITICVLCVTAILLVLVSRV